MFNPKGKYISMEEAFKIATKEMYGVSKTLEQITREIEENPREVGNGHYKQGVYYVALTSYSAALMQSHDDEAEKSLCYANRAACYLEMKFFKNCLNSLDLAEPHYPAKKIQKLHERREKCLKMMTEEPDAGQIKLEHPFSKLTYEPNPKLPFFIDAIELKQNEVFGRHLITNQDLKAGDVIAVIDRTLKCREHDQRASECANCLKTNSYDLFASSECEQALFCSQSCLDDYIKIDREALLEIELTKKMQKVDVDNAQYLQSSIMTVKMLMQMLNCFDSIADMRKFVEENEKVPRNVFDFDWSDLDEPNFLRNVLCCILSAETGRKKSKEFKGFITTICGSLSTHLEFSQFLCYNRAKHGDFIEKFCWETMKALESFKNSVANTMGAIQFSGSFFHPCMLMINHSCDPNVFSTMVDENKVAWIANRPIEAGQQLFVCNTPYNSEFYSSDIMFGKSFCEFKNSCVPCQNGWRMSLDPQVYAQGGHWQPMTVSCDKLMQCREEAARNIKAGCEYINKNFKGYETDAKIRMKIVKKLQEMKRQCEVLCYHDIHLRKWMFPVKN